MKNIFYFFLILCCSGVFSQNADLTSAIISFNKGENKLAKEAIDNATKKIESGSVLKAKKIAKYYHYRGLIYVRIFQIDSINPLRFNLLNTAVNSLLEDATLNSVFSKKSIIQLNICSNIYASEAYKDYQNGDYLSALSKFISAININSS